MLPPRTRLASSAGFRAVYSRGRSNRTDLIVLYVLPRPGGTRVRFGFTAGKRVGGAVKRNRAKRLMREAARALIEQINESYDIVVVARNTIIESGLKEVIRDLEHLLIRAKVLSGAEKK